MWFSYAAILFLIAGIYTYSTASGPSPGANSGELIATGSTLGISHPTGYPVWTLIAHAFSTFLPLGDRAFRINYLSAVCIAAALGIILLIFKTLSVKGIFAVVFTTAAAFHPAVFSEALNAEVYAFHLFLTAALAGTCIKFRVSRDIRFSLLAAFIAGISLSNHLLALFNLPLLLCLLSRQKNRPTFAASHLILFLTGLSPYLYLPIRAGTRPLISWHQPGTLIPFLQHISGTEFHGHLTSELHHTMAENFRILLRITAGFPGVIFITAGLAGILLLSKKLKNPDRLAMILFFAGIILFPLVYEIHDIHSYFLVPIVFLITLSSQTAAAMPRLRRHLSSRGGFYAGFLVLFSLIMHSKDIQRFQIPLLRYYGQTLLAGTPRGSRLYFQGDNAMNALAVCIAVDKYRDDLLLMDQNENLEPIRGAEYRSRTSKSVSKTYRSPSDFALFQPNAMVYIARTEPYSAAGLTRLSNHIIHMAGTRRSPWNPSFDELVAQMQINLAETEFEHGSWDTGMDHLSRSLERSASPRIIRYVASLLAARGELGRALTLLETLNRQFPEDSDSLNNRAYYMYLTGSDLDRALNIARQAVDLEPENASVVLTYYRLLLATGNLESAEILESNHAPLIAPQVTIQRRLLETLESQISANVMSYTTTEQIQHALEILPLPALNHHYRLLLTRKILMMNHGANDLEQLADLCISMKIPQSALFVVNQSDLQNSSDAVQTKNALDRACHNYSRVR